MLCGHRHRVTKQINTFPDWQISEWKEQRFHFWSWLLSNKFVMPSAMVPRDIRRRFIHAVAGIYVQRRAGRKAFGRLGGYL